MLGSGSLVDCHLGSSHLLDSLFLAYFILILMYRQHEMLVILR